LVNLVPLSIALRYSRSKKSNSFVAFINAFSVAGIALGLMALITVVSVMNGFEAQLKQRVLGVVPHLIVYGSDGVKTSDHSQIKAVMPFEEVDAVVQSKNAIRGLQVQGIEPSIMEEHSVFANNMLFGSLNLEPGSFDVIVGRSLAVQLDINPGDRLRLLVAGKAIYTPFGRVPSQRLVRVAGFFDLGSQADDTAVLMHWKDVQKLKRVRSDEPSSMRLFLHDAFRYADVQDWLETKDIDSESWRHLQGTLFDAVKMEKNLMFTMLLLIISVAAFNIISALVMVVTEKQADVAILQTQGMNPRAIMGIFLFNGALNGVKGAGYGLVLGTIVIWGINPLLNALGLNLALAADGRAVPIVIDIPQIASVIGLSILLCVLASLYPSYRAMRIQPAQVLHNS
jgi:lipoprotein-releasing system permease protein